MAQKIATKDNYWISPNAVSISLNALGDADRIHCSAASGSTILCYMKGVTEGDGLEFDVGHKYKFWPLSISPTYFDTHTEKYVYVAIPRTAEKGMTARFVFPSEKLDVYGRSVTGGDDPEDTADYTDFPRLVSAFSPLVAASTGRAITENGAVWQYLRTLYGEAWVQYYEARSQNGLPVLYRQENFPQVYNVYGTATSDVTFKKMAAWIVAMTLSELVPQIRDDLYTAAYKYATNDTLEETFRYTFSTDHNIARMVASAIFAALRKPTLISALRSDINGTTITYRSEMSEVYVDTRRFMPPAPGPYTAADNVDDRMGENTNGLVPGGYAPGQDPSIEHNLQKDLAAHEHIYNNYSLTASNTQMRQRAVQAIADKDSSVKHLFGAPHTVTDPTYGELSFNPVFGAHNIGIEIPVDGAIARLVKTIGEPCSWTRRSLLDQQYGRRRPGQGERDNTANADPKQRVLVNHAIEDGDGNPTGYYSRDGELTYNANAVEADDYEEYYQKELWANSYPSGHSAYIWGIAVILMEVMPDRADKILKAAVEYCNSRMIARYHWASDTVHGRIIGSTMVPVLHALTNYDVSGELSAARAEYISLGGNPDIQSATAAVEAATPEQIGSEDFFYIWMQGIISSSGSDGQTPRTWLQRPDWGWLDSSEQYSAGGDGSWWIWNPVTDMVTFLKRIAYGAFEYLFAQQAEIKNLSVTGTATLQDASVSGQLTANHLQSTQYTGDGMFDTGYILQYINGKAKLVIDNLVCRGKFIINEIEDRIWTYSGGNLIFSAAGSTIFYVEYLDGDGQPMGYTRINSPWLLRKVPLLAGLIAWSKRKTIQRTLTPEEKARVRIFRCYETSDDGTMQTRNWWHINDIAFCQTLNRVKDKTVTSGGYSGSLSNTVYARKVVNIGSKRIEFSDDNRIYDYVDLSLTDCDPTYNDWPAAGDVIVQRGNPTDEGRQGWSTIEVTGEQRGLKVYDGVTGYSLENKKRAFIGYDANLKRALLEVFGDCYIGAMGQGSDIHDGSTYIRYNAETKKLEIKAQISAESTISGKEVDEFIESIIDPVADILQGNIDTAQNTANGAADAAAGAQNTASNALSQAQLAKQQADSVNYIKVALAQKTDVQGGLILTSMIALRDGNSRIWSGMNGVYSDGNTIAAWYGGEAYDIVRHPEYSQQRYAKALFRMDGTGYLASGNIKWDSSGNVTANTVTVNTGTLQLGGTDYTDQIKALAGMFVMDGNWIKAKYNFYSVGEIAMNSDIRMKDILQRFQLDVEKIAGMSLVRFLWKDRRDKYVHVGGIAQEWQEVLPQAVHEQPDGTLTLNYTAATYASVVSLSRKVVEQQETIRRQQETIRRQQQKIDELEERLKKIERMFGIS